MHLWVSICRASYPGHQWPAADRTERISLSKPQTTITTHNSYTGYRYASWVDFKAAMLVHRSLSDISPPYLADDCHLVADAHERWLRSTARWTCVVTRTYSTFGDRAFAAAGPGLQNGLLSHLKEADLSYIEFQQSPNTFFWTVWFHSMNSFNCTI